MQYTRSHIAHWQKRKKKNKQAPKVSQLGSQHKCTHQHIDTSKWSVCVCVCSFVLFLVDCFKFNCWSAIAFAINVFFAIVAVAAAVAVFNANGWFLLRPWIHSYEYFFGILHITSRHVKSIWNNSFHLCYRI